MKYRCNMNLLKVGLPVDLIGPNLSCFCSNDVGWDRSVHSPANIHVVLNPLQYMSG